MATLPPGRLTFGQIRDLALRRAGNQGIVADAGSWLSQVLYELYVAYEFPFLFATTTITFSSPSFALPPDFLKPQDDRSFEIQTWNGSNAFGANILETDRFTFDSVAANNTVLGMPNRWTADRTLGVGLLFPNPTGNLGVAQFRYKQLPTAETTPPPAANPLANDAIVPVFPYHLYLVQALYVIALQHENDSRADAEEARRDRELQKLLATALPLRSFVSVVPLDPEVFGPVFSGDGGGEDF